MIGRVGTARRGTRLNTATTGAGVLIWLLAWELAGRAHLLGNSWPPLTEVFAYAHRQPERGLLINGARATSVEALQGYLIATVVACALGGLSALLPGLGKGLTNAVVMLNTIPIIVLGPLFLATLSSARAPIAMSALMVLLTMYVSIASGLNSATETHRAVFVALGSSRARRFWSLDLPSAIPALVDGLKVSAPLAFLGVIIGEWFGAENGIGPLLVSAMQNFQADLLWASALATVILSASVFLLLSILQRVVAQRFQ